MKSRFAGDREMFSRYANGVRAIPGENQIERTPLA